MQWQLLNREEVACFQMGLMRSATFLATLLPVCLPAFPHFVLCTLTLQFTAVSGQSEFDNGIYKTLRIITGNFNGVLGYEPEHKTKEPVGTCVRYYVPQPVINQNGKDLPKYNLVRISTSGYNQLHGNLMLNCVILYGVTGNLNNSRISFFFSKLHNYTYQK